jgi:cyclophilin family peptidyl-prolyl cis-trans isomerase
MRTVAIIVACALVAALASAQIASRPASGPATASAATQKETTVTANPIVLMSTSEGDIKIELFADKAPISVKNFLRYVDEGHYDGTIFHRVIKGFMIQGGGFDAEFNEKSAHAAIRNEAGNGLKNVRGTLAMARTNEVDSATAQFFINVVDSDFLDHRDETARGFGYAVFGKVIEGMDVADKIRNAPTGRKGPFPQDAPLETRLIKSVKRVQQ